MKTNKPRCYSYIRFSSPEQLRGDSLSRQLKLSQNYAERRGLILDQSLCLRDLGISAFRGHNSSKGALSQFLKLVENGRIPKGSYLLVESLDRLSREQVLHAFDQFRAIIKGGITIVTLADGREYSEGTLATNINNLIISLSIMSRAHEESLMKSKRLSSAWKAKREKSPQKKLTAKCPAWLELNGERDEFIEIPERCDLVKRIFSLHVSGKGADSICRMFNREKIPSWGRSKTGWHRSYVQKILRNRAVLGEFQPHKKVDGKRVPVGDPVADYFPRIITDPVFYRVQEKLRKNTKFSGKNGKVSNLFGGLAKCGYCGASMAFLNKGKPPRGNKYLVCDRSRRGGECQYHSLKYDEFEKSVLNFCRGLNVNDLLNEGENKKSQIDVLQNLMVEIDGKLKNTKSKIENITDKIADTSDKRIHNYLEERLISLFDGKEELERLRRDSEQKLAVITDEQNDAEMKISDIKNLFSAMETKSDNELIDLRLKIRSKLRELIKAIIVYPIGYTPELVKKSVDALPFVEPGISDEQIEYLRKHFESKMGDKKFRKFTMIFEHGISRTIEPGIESSAFSLEIDQGIMDTCSGETACQWILDEKEGHWELKSLKNIDGKNEINYDEMQKVARKYGLDLPKTMLP